jgi:hypothetical protein
MTKRKRRKKLLAQLTKLLLVLLAQNLVKEKLAVLKSSNKLDAKVKSERPVKLIGLFY